MNLINNVSKRSAFTSALPGSARTELYPSLNIKETAIPQTYVPVLPKDRKRKSASRELKQECIYHSLFMTLNKYVDTANYILYQKYGKYPAVMMLVNCFECTIYADQIVSALKLPVIWVYRICGK